MDFWNTTTNYILSLHIVPSLPKKQEHLFAPYIIRDILIKRGGNAKSDQGEDKEADTDVERGGVESRE